MPDWLPLRSYLALSALEVGDFEFLSCPGSERDRYRSRLRAWLSMSKATYEYRWSVKASKGGFIVRKLNMWPAVKWRAKFNLQLARRAARVSEMRAKEAVSA